MKYVTDPRLTFTHGVNAVPCPLRSTRSIRRSFETIAMVTRESHYRINQVIVAFITSIRWGIQKSAVYFCNNYKRPVAAD